MKRVGQVLKEARIAARLTLEEVEKKTKIRKKNLVALEESNYSDLPPPTYVKGLIKNYGQFLGLSPNSLLALFRREYSGLEKETLSATFLNLPFKFRLTPGLTISVFGALAVLGLVVYIGIQYFSLISAPRLEIKAPADFLRTSERQTEIIGQTDHDATVSVNSEKVDLDEDGNFKVQITLAEGLNEVEIVAKSKFGREKKVKRTITVSPQSEGKT